MHKCLVILVLCFAQFIILVILGTMLPAWSWSYDCHYQWQIFDAGSSFMIHQVEEEFDDSESDDGNEDVVAEPPAEDPGIRSSTRPSISWSVDVSKTGGIQAADPNQFVEFHLEIIIVILPKYSYAGYLVLNNYW